MGTSKPLTILIHPDYWETPWAADLRAKGHVVAILETNIQADLILGPTCARFVPGMEKFLDSFLKGARVVRYPGSKKEPT